MNWLEGNIDEDPLFGGTGEDPYSLLEDSPCIDAGDPYDAYSNEPEPNGSRINMGVYGNSVEASKSSFASTPPMPNENNEMKIYPNPYIKRKIKQFYLFH